MDCSPRPSIKRTFAARSHDPISALVAARHRFVAATAGTFEGNKRFLCGVPFRAAHDPRRFHVTTENLFLTRDGADLAALDGATVAVLGYGNLGRSMALNLNDSGLTVVVGNRDDKYRQAAADDGMDVTDIATAVARADIVYVLLADEVIPDVYASDIAHYLRPQSALCFASGYVLAFGLVTPAADVDVLLLAPRMLGEEVRTNFLDGRGFFSYVSVEQDASGTAEVRLMALACGHTGPGRHAPQRHTGGPPRPAHRTDGRALPGHGHPAGIRHRSGQRATPGGARFRAVHVGGNVANVPDFRRGRLLPVRHLSWAGRPVRGLSRRPRPRPQGNVSHVWCTG